MTDERYVLNQDNRERSASKTGARHKKCGAKSKKCKLSTDGMSRKKWMEHNGEVITLKLNEPMSFVQLKTYSKEQRYLYLQNLIDKYDCTLRDLSDMLGCSYSTITNSEGCGFLEKKLVVRHKNRYTAPDKTKWDEFIAGDKKETIQITCVDDAQEESVKATDELVAQVETADKPEPEPKPARPAFISSNISLLGSINDAIAMLKRLVDDDVVYKFDFAIAATD